MSEAKFTEPLERIGNEDGQGSATRSCCQARRNGDFGELFHGAVGARDFSSDFGSSEFLAQ